MHAPPPAPAHRSSPSPIIRTFRPEASSAAMCAVFPPGNTAAKWGTPSSACDRPYRGLAITGNDLDRKADALQFGDRRRRIRPQTVLKTKTRPDGCRSLASTTDSSPDIRSTSAAASKRPFRPAEPVDNRSRARLKPVSGMLGDFVELRPAMRDDRRRLRPAPANRGDGNGKPVAAAIAISLMIHAT